MKLNNQYNLKFKKINLPNCFVGKRNEFIIYDLDFRFQQLIRAKRLLDAVTRHQGVVWWVGTDQVSAKYLIRNKSDFPKSHSLLIQSWVPGLLTNLKTFQKIASRFFKINTICFSNLRFFDKLLLTSFWKRFNIGLFQQRKKGDRFKTFLSLSLQRSGQLSLPQLIIVLNPKDNPVLLIEASKLNIPIICFGFDYKVRSNCLVLPINQKKGSFITFCQFLLKDLVFK